MRPHSEVIADNGEAATGFAIGSELVDGRARPGRHGMRAAWRLDAETSLKHLMGRRAQVTRLHRPGGETRCTGRECRAPGHRPR